MALPLETQVPLTAALSTGKRRDLFHIFPWSHDTVSPSSSDGSDG